MKKKDSIHLTELKTKQKEIKKAVEEEQRKGKVNELCDKPDSSQAWKSVRSILGIIKSVSPTSIQDENSSLTSNPTKLATIFNDFFLEKVRKLRSLTNSPRKLDPVTGLQQWLSKRGKPLPPFSLKEINIKQLRKIFKKMKGGKSSGIDGIDSYSLRLAAHLLEDASIYL